jgi:hypothetical protein
MAFRFTHTGIRTWKANILGLVVHVQETPVQQLALTGLARAVQPFNHDQSPAIGLVIRHIFFQSFLSFRNNNIASSKLYFSLSLFLSVACR